MPELEQQIRQHASWVRYQMPPLDDPSSSAVGPQPQPSSVDRSNRAGRRVWLAAAAVAMVLIAGALAARWMRSEGGTRPNRSPASPIAQPDVHATGGQAAVLPTATPGGLVMWSLTTSAPTAPALAPGVVASTRQLLGAGGHPEMLITISSGTDVGSGVIVGQQQSPQTIRGQAGTVTREPFPPGAQPTTASPPTTADRQALTPDTLSWHERGATVTVSFRQLSLAQALAVANHLTWVDQDPLHGFAAPSTGGLAPLAVPALRTTAGAGVVTDATYATGPGASSDLDVTACPEGGGCTGDFAQSWFGGTRLADGSAEMVVLDPNTGVPVGLIRTWPGGAGIQVRVDAWTGRDLLDLPVARTLVASVRPTDLAGVARVQAQITHQLEALPLIARAALPHGTVEVHAAGGLTSVCLAVTGHPVTCPSAAFSDPAHPPTAPFTGGALVDGHWWLAAASLPHGAFAFQADTGAIPPTGPTWAADNALSTDDGQPWQLGLAQVPDGVDQVLVTYSGPFSIGGGGAGRPAG